MAQVTVLACKLQTDEALLKCDLKDGYYHLHLRRCDELILALDFPRPTSPTHATVAEVHELAAVISSLFRNHCL